MYGDYLHTKIRNPDSVSITGWWSVLSLLILLQHNEYKFFLQVKDFIIQAGANFEKEIVYT